MPPDPGLLAALSAKKEEEPSGPREFALALPVALTTETAGSWQRLPDRTRRWKLSLTSPGAANLSLGFRHFSLPPGGKLWISSADGTTRLGPFQGADRSHTGRFYTGLVAGDEILLELSLPPRGRHRLELEQLHHGYRPAFAKAGSCNIDVVCPEADPWRNVVRSVATTTVGGTRSCSGALVANTSREPIPYFLTAQHCGITSANADTLVVFWNFESPTCGRLDGGRLDQTTSGARLRMSHGPTDTTLLELDHQPDPSYRVYYAGWDATGTRPSGSAGIHHPSFDEKAISIDRHAPTDSDNPASPTGQLTHWRVGQWEQGTVEPGSSGSCLFDNAARCIGVLSAGTASCSNPGGFDVYGKLSRAWTGNATPGTSLGPWLDPLGGGSILSTDGLDPLAPESGEPGPCAEGSLCLLGGQYELTVEWTNQHDGSTGVGAAFPSTDFAGFFSFTDPRNIELLAKAIDFGSVVKIFYGQLTNLHFTLSVRETATGRTRRYENTAGDCGGVDGEAFPKFATGTRNATGSCVPSPTRLCLQQGRFALEASWRNPFTDESGEAGVTTLSDFTGAFDYGDPSNLELVAKVLDFGDHVLLLYGALSDFAYTLRVTDTSTGAHHELHNPGGRYCGGIIDDL